MRGTRLARKLMTVEEFSAFVHRPENRDRWFELVRGEVIELPPPKRLHGSVCGNVGGWLYVYKRDVGWGDVTVNDAGLVLEHDPDTVRGPDVAFYGETQTEEEVGGYSHTPPLLAVKVLSPDDKANQVARKIADFLANGVQLVWVVDPQDRTVVVHRQGQLPKVLCVADEITGEDVLPGFRCAVADFFPPAPQATAPKAPKKKRRNGKTK
jgi:Uma2 family endonuclease